MWLTKKSPGAPVIVARGIMHKNQMILVIYVLISSILLSGCGAGQLFGPTLTPIPTLTSTPTVTITPTPTATPTPTTTPTITPTPLPTLEYVPCRADLGSDIELSGLLNKGMPNITWLSVTFASDSSNPKTYVEVNVTEVCSGDTCNARAPFAWTVPQLPKAISMCSQGGIPTVGGPVTIKPNTWQFTVYDNNNNIIEQEKGPWSDLVAYDAGNITWNELWAGITIIQ